MAPQVKVSSEQKIATHLLKRFPALTEPSSQHLSSCLASSVVKPLLILMVSFYFCDRISYAVLLISSANNGKGKLVPVLN
jgi:hypothetical protein